MEASTIVTLAALVCLIVILLYKRELVLQLFQATAAPQLPTPAVEFHMQLQRTADEVIARLEKRIMQLEDLLEQADQKIALLENTVQSAPTVAEPAEVLSFVPPVRAAALYKTGNGFIESVETPAASETKEQTSTLTAASGTASDKHRVIAAMSEQGYTITEIAKAVGMGKGEVMLILQLHKK